MGAALRKTQRDLEKINEKNSKSLLVKLSPELFDNVIGRVSILPVKDIFPLFSARSRLFLGPKTEL